MCKKYFVFAILIAVGSHASSFLEDSIIIDGIKRQYVYKFPENYNQNKKIPVIIALHGGGSNWKKFNRATTKYTLAEASNHNKLLLIYPEGKNKHWNDGRDTTNPFNDVEFISQLIDKSIQKYHADANRIYVTGMSNGGFMAIRLAQELSEKITAVAAVSAQVSVNNQNIPVKFPRSFMLINGTDDPIVPYQGGDMKPFKFSKSKGVIFSTQRTIKLFVENNKCNPVPITHTQNKRKFDKTKLQINEYANCINNTHVQLIKVIGGGHLWPGGKQYLPVAIIGKLSREINASNIIVEFFLSTE